MSDFITKEINKKFIHSAPSSTHMPNCHLLVLQGGRPPDRTGFYGVSASLNHTLKKGQPCPIWMTRYVFITLSSSFVTSFCCCCPFLTTPGYESTKQGTIFTSFNQRSFVHFSSSKQGLHFIQKKPNIVCL